MSVINSALLVSRETNQGKPFSLMVGDFLEDFYYVLKQNPEDLYKMIEQSPEDMEKIEQLPYLAAMAHKLANDYNLAVPSWVFEKRCYLPGDKPYFTPNNKGNLSLWMMFNSPSEFKHRNLFVCENELVRV
jgi:hypothetical protein